MKIALKMTGCRNNRYELDRILKWAIENKIPVVKEEEADYCVINTCTVTHVADKKSRQMIRRTKNANANLKTIVFGCAARVQKEYFEKITEIDYLMEDLNSVIYFLNECKKSEATIAYDESYETELRSRAMIQIQDGCDNYCAYCIIATARGGSKSHPMEQIIQEARKYREEGYNEIVLTGINIGAYGAEKTTRPKESRFSDLLEELLEKTHIPRIRISSMGPEYFSDKLFEVLKHPRICRHIHLSVQSGSETVLRRMLRQYDATHADYVINKLKSTIPDIAITTDFITGFPGESEEEFNETFEFIKQNPLAKVHVFPYSVRENTLAAKMPQVPEDIKKERAKILQELADDQRKQFIANQLGKNVSVLWEKEVEDGVLEGITDNYIRVQKKTDNPIRSISMEELIEDMVIL